MDLTDLLDEIEERASRGGVPMYAVCDRAGVSFAAWAAWRRGAHSPTLRKLQAVREAVDLVLLERRAEIDLVLGDTQD